MNFKNNLNKMLLLFATKYLKNQNSILRKNQNLTFNKLRSNLNFCIDLIKLTKNSQKFQILKK